MKSSKNIPIRFSNNNPFEDDKKEVFEMVVDVSTSKIYVLLRYSKIYYE